MQVCRQFRNIFLEHSYLHALLYLPRWLDDGARESLLAWVGQHRLSVKELCAPNRQATSAVVVRPWEQSIGPANPTSFSHWDRGCLLSSFSALTRCTLHVAAFSSAAQLDLGLLQDLHHLKFLSLEGSGSGQGVCCELNAVQHLTKLMVFGADVSFSADCSFVESLQSLDVQCGKLTGVHSAGVAAFQQLRHLRCRSATISAQAEVDTSDTSHDATHVPNSISTLTHLSHLQVEVDKSPSLAPGAELVLNWLPGLTNFRKLDLVSDYRYTLPSGISALSNLEDLRLTFYSDYTSWLDVDWAALHNLRQVYILGESCVFADELQRLAEVSTLRHIHLGTITGLEEYLGYVPALTQYLEKHASRVTVHLDKVLM